MALTTVPVELASLDGAVTVNESSADADFRVESNGDTHRLFIDGGNDRVLIGTTASRTMSGVTSDFFIEGTAYGDSSIGMAINANGANDCPALFFGKSRGTSLGSNTIVQDGDRLFSMRIDGSDGTNLEQAAVIEVHVDAAPGANEIPGRITFMTTTAGSQYATEKMRIDNAGNVGIKTATPGSFNGAGNDLVVGAGTSGDNNGITIYTNANATGHLLFADGTSGTDGYTGYIGYNHPTNHMSFHTSGGTERMRIDSSGYALIGRTSASFGATTGIVFRPNNDSYVIVNEAPCLTLRRNTTNGDIMQFYRDGTQVGYISVDASSTSYQSGSDYRLKDNVTYDWEALPRLAQLKPARFNFKVDPDSTVDGFLAHEAQAVVPNAVGGTYNETKDISNVVLDAEGNVLEEGVTEDDWKAGKEAEEGKEPKYAADTTWKAKHTKDVYQGMDHSKLVPLMVKAIQEQQALIETLEAKVKALEEA